MYPYVNTKVLPGSYRAHRCVHLYAVTDPAVRGVATVTPLIPKLSQVATLSEAGIAQIDSAYCQREVSHAHHYVR